MGVKAAMSQASLAHHVRDPHASDPSGAKPARRRRDDALVGLRFRLLRPPHTAPPRINQLLELFSGYLVLVYDTCHIYDSRHVNSVQYHAPAVVGQSQEN